MPINPPSRASSKAFGFVSLLFYADPTWLDKTLLGVGFIAAIATGVPFPLIGIIFGQLVDNLNEATCDEETAAASSAGMQSSSINDKILLMVYIAIGLFALLYTHIVCWNIFSQRLAQRIRERYLKNLLRQDIAFFDNLQAGEVSSRLNGDIQAIETGTCEKVGIALSCVSFCVAAYVIAFIKDARLAGMLVALIPAFLLMAIVGGHYVQKYSTNVAKCFASASTVASEALSHVGLVHALGAGPRLEEQFRAHLSSARKEGIRKALATAVQAGLLYFIALAANALAYWQGSQKIANSVESGGNATVGQTYTVILILVDGAVVLSQVAPLLPLFGAAVAAYNRLRKDIDHQPSIDSTSNAGATLSKVEGAIDFNNVFFTYPSRPDHPVLRSVSFRCEAGKSTAIVGLSGSGKSTIAALLTRFYDPEQGNIAIDGHDIKDLNVRSLRGFISLVPQEPALLDRSILENIAQGLVNSPSHSHLQQTLLTGSIGTLAEQVRSGQELAKSAENAGPQVAEILDLAQKAAELADASNFIDRLEHGLATSVGSSGNLISGGQKQRIALARALIRDPKILLLDEATAALDSASEQRIQAAIEKASKGRTVISIAHRLSTIKAANKIVVMRTGEIIEQGTHEELINLEGSTYADMVRLQSVKPEDGNGTSTRSSADDDVDDITKQPSAASGQKEASQSTVDCVQPKATDTATDDTAEPAAKSITTTMIPIVRPYLIYLVLAFFAALIVGCTYPASGLIFGNMIGSLTPCYPADFIRSRGLLLSGMFFMLACAEFFANFASWACFGLISERVTYKARVLSFSSLLRQPLQWHESSNRSPNKLLSYITNDGNALAGFSGSIIGTLSAVVINFIIAIILSHIVAWRIAIVCLVIIPLLLGAGFMQFRAISRFAAKHAGAFSSSVGISVEAVSNIRVVAALSLENEILQTYRRSLKSPRKAMVVQSLKSNVWLAIAHSCGYFIYAFAYWWGSRNILEGRYTQTEFFIILFAMLISAQLWGQVFTLAPEIAKAKSAISRIVGLIELNSDPSRPTPSRSTLDEEDDFNEKKDIEALADPTSLPSSTKGASVEFNDVCFSYPARPNTQVLTSLSLAIQPGQFCALVGPSGAGKSTVFALLERFYSPLSGSISISGFNLAGLHGTSFRDDIAYVPQESTLFQGSIRFNLCLGARPGHMPTDAELEEACKLANIQDTIVSLPQGYDTECGANGSQLSVGQRQRLSIARALVRKPKLLLLDESTSALDAESEKALEQGLEKAVKGHGVTVVAIAHRLRTIARADVIFLIDGGRVVDQGRHEELVQRSESYRINALHQMLA